MTAHRISEETAAIFDGDEETPATTPVVRCHWCDGQVGTRDWMILSVDEMWVHAHRGPCPPTGEGAKMTRPVLRPGMNRHCRALGGRLRRYASIACHRRRPPTCGWASKCSAAPRRNPSLVERSLSKWQQAPRPEEVADRPRHDRRGRSGRQWVRFGWGGSGVLFGLQNRPGLASCGSARPSLLSCPNDWDLPPGPFGPEPSNGAVGSSFSPENEHHDRP